MNQKTTCNSFAGDSLDILKQEVKVQNKHVKSLKKKSLWSKNLEEVGMRCLCTKLLYYQMLAMEDIFRILITTKHFRTLLKLQASFPIILFQGLNITFFFSGDSKACRYCPLLTFGDIQCLRSSWYNPYLWILHIVVAQFELLFSTSVSSFLIVVLCGNNKQIFFLS